VDDHWALSPLPKHSVSKRPVFFAGLCSYWEVYMRYFEELQSILSRFGAGPTPKDEVVQYLTRQSSETDDRDAESIPDYLEVEGYVETVSGEKGELFRFTDKAIDEGFG
jgi:hypothetical protein